MKKFLGIIVLGLLWSMPIANSDTCLAGCGAKEAKKFPWKAQYVATKSPNKMQPFCVSCYFIGGAHTLEEAKKKALYLCQNSKHYKKKNKQCYYDPRVHASINPGMVKKEKEAKLKKNTEKQKQISLESDIKQFKAMCKNIGYSNGTEKFADCVKDLYIRSLEAKSQTTTSTPKRKIDPSVWDDIISLSTGVMNGSSKSKTPKQVCFRTGQEKIGFGKSCRYSCTGSLYTMMVGSLELCPLTVER